MDEIINELVRLGWVHDGETIQETVRIPTCNSPLLNHGKSGGEIRTFGGRTRLHKGNWFVTIGKRTTCFYQRNEGGVYSSRTFKSILPLVIAAEGRLMNGGEKL